MGTYDHAGLRSLVLVCHGSSCRKAGAEKVREALEDECDALGVRDVLPVRTECLGRCKECCNVVVTRDQTWYAEVTPKTMRRIVLEHIVGGTPAASHVRYAEKDGVLVAVGDGPRGKPRK